MKISAARLDAQSGRVDNAVLKDYAETTVGGAGGTNSGTAYTIDLSTGNTFTVFLNANCTFTFTNPPTAGKALPFTIILKQDGGTRTATWPSTVIWQSGTAPPLTTTAGAVHILTFMTLDAGTSYFGFAGAATTVAAPASTSYALWAWGANSKGQLGQADTVARSVPTQVGTLATWSQVAHVVNSASLALKTDNTFWTFGYNTKGYLGLGDVINRSSPVQVGGIIAWSTPSSSTYGFSGFIIKTDGTLWTWGNNNYGLLGLGNTAYRSSPVQVGTLATWASVSNNTFSASAIKSDGTLWAWGKGATFGNLGLGDVINRSSPVQVGTIGAWAKVRVGRNFVAATKTDGTLWSWGANTGQLGQNDTVSRSSPVQVGTLTTWSAISADQHVLALKTDSTLWSWGTNAYGQLGFSDVINRSSPVQVGTLATWSDIQAGNHSVALKTDNTLWVWGQNSSGELGFADAVKRSSPVQVGGGAAWKGIASGQNHTLALQDPSLLANSQLFSWGSNTSGQLGLDDAVARSSPVQVGTVSTWAVVASGGTHSVALKSDSSLWVSGKNDFGQLRLGDVVLRSSPVQVGGLLPWSQIAAGYHHSLALKTNGTLWIWGRNNKGQTGQADAITAHRSSPVQVGTLATWSYVTGGVFQSAAAKTDGTIWTWGYNNRGQLGLGDGVYRSSPVQVGAGTTWAKLSAGYYHTFSIKTDGTLWGWGRNEFGQLALADIAHRSSPVQIGTLATWSHIAGTHMSTLALKTDGTLWGWGKSDYGQLGLGDAVNRSSPVQLGTLTTWVAVAGGKLSLALKTDGTLWGWGNNAAGELGLGDAVKRSSPVQIGTLSTWQAVGRGNFPLHATALLWPPTTTTTAPGKPTNVLATVGSASGTAVVVWTPPISTGGKPISQYTVTSSPGSITANTNGTFATVSGLTNGTAYTFTVTATNSVGTSSASAASNSVTPPVQGG